jgi:hypothetical protein
MKGPAGYGRYDDDPAYVGCPWARSDMTPCIARDGRLALADAGVCVGCGRSPEEQFEDLATEYPPARDTPARLGEPVTAADEFALMVREATEPGREAV